MLSRQREPKVYRPGDRREPEDSGEARAAGAYLARQGTKGQQARSLGLPSLVRS